jgi:hypothetical protein
VNEALILAVLFGVPIFALSLAIAYHAYLYRERELRGKPRTTRPEHEAAAQLAASAPMPSAGTGGETVTELKRTVDELQDQLHRQRDTLYGMLSETAQRQAREGAAARHAAASGQPDFEDLGAPEGDLVLAVQRLLSEGFSDRAIARRLRVGLEEVRLLAQRASGGAR